MKGPLKSDLGLSRKRPVVPGKAIEYVYLPARGFMKGRLIRKGEVIRIITVKGNQCADCIIWDAEDFSNVLSCCMTMALNGKWNKWQPGDVFYSKNCERLAVVSEDTSGGIHAAFGAFCNEPYSRLKTGIPGCPNCRDNLVAAMADYDFSAEDLDWGSCVTLFMSVHYLPDGSLTITEPSTKPGDYVDLMAERDIVLAISNCPAERSPSAYHPTPLQAVIFDPHEEYRRRIQGVQKVSMGEVSKRIISEK